MSNENNVMMNETAENTAIAIMGTRDELATGVTPAELMNPTQSQMYCTLKDDGTPKSKGMIYNAINNPDKKIADVIGEVILLKNIVAHTVDLVDEQTGEMIQALRVILIDDKGISYEAVSGGIANSLSRLLQIYGQPATWKEPIKIKARQKSTRNGNNKVTTLEVVL